MNTYTCSNIENKHETVHLSQDGHRSLCGRQMTSTSKRLWRQREKVEHLKKCKVCLVYAERRAAA